MFGFDFKFHQGCIPLNSHENVIEVMGDATGQRSNGFHLLCLLELSCH